MESSTSLEELQQDVEREKNLKSLEEKYDILNALSEDTIESVPITGMYETRTTLYVEFTVLNEFQGYIEINKEETMYEETNIDILIDCIDSTVDEIEYNSIDLNLNQDYNTAEITAGAEQKTVNISWNIENKNEISQLSDSKIHSKFEKAIKTHEYKTQRDEHGVVEMEITDVTGTTGDSDKFIVYVDWGGAKSEFKIPFVADSNKSNELIEQAGGKPKFLEGTTVHIVSTRNVDWKKGNYFSSSDWDWALLTEDWLEEYRDNQQENTTAERTTNHSKRLPVRFRDWWKYEVQNNQKTRDMTAKGNTIDLVMVLPVMLFLSLGFALLLLIESYSNILTDIFRSIYLSGSIESAILAAIILSFTIYFVKNR